MDTHGLIQTKEPGLLRDLRSKALLSADKGALERHRRELARKRQQTQLEGDVRNLQAEVRIMREQLDTLIGLLTERVHG